MEAFLKIAIASIGRFHVADLARELSHLGHQVVFYSDVPNSRLQTFGLTKTKNITIWIVTLLSLLQKIFPKFLIGHTQLIDRLRISIFDWLLSFYIEPCDVFIGMSGIILKSGKTAKKRFNAKIYVERGSRHIHSQQEILSTNPSASATVIDHWIIKRELSGYDMADKIVVPSNHVLESFIERGTPRNRLFVNTYGVDLAMFPWTPVSSQSSLTAIFVGAWSWRKGCDLLQQIFPNLKSLRLLHVGSMADADNSLVNGIIHVGSVHPTKLSTYYRDCHMLILPSREEGLSLVQIQALASGLPVLCTDKTGGEDLQMLLSNPERIKIVPAGDLNALQTAIESYLPLALQLRNQKFPDSDRARLSWGEYGVRYDRELRQECSEGVSI